MESIAVVIAITSTNFWKSWMLFRSTLSARYISTSWSWYTLYVRVIGVVRAYICRMLSTGLTAIGKGWVVDMDR